MAAGSAPWSLTISSDLRWLNLARTFVETVCHVAGVDEMTTHAIVLATDEATNNIMKHAHENHPEAMLQIQCYPLADGLEIRLLDEGQPFDIAAVPYLDPAEFRIGGRGVFLMRSLMDEISCVPRGSGGNTLRMIKRCSRITPNRTAG